MPTRRTFLRLSSAAAVAAASPKLLRAQRVGPPVFSNAALGAYAQGLMTREHFLKVVGSSFHIFLEDDATAELQLVEVTTPAAMITAAAAANAQTAAAEKSTASLLKLQPTPDQCFLLKFTSGSAVIPQGSYVLDHGTLGSFTVFLVPGNPAKDVPSVSVTATFYNLAAGLPTLVASPRVSLGSMATKISDTLQILQ